MQFSIVIPAYNRADTILPTLQSVQAQTFDDFECLIVDDGSKDGAALKQVVEGMNDPRFHYIHRENGGGGAARNTGIMAAKGDYIAFLDSDDFFLPEKLERDLSMLRSHKSQHPAVFSQIIVDRGVGKSWIKPPRPPYPDEHIDEYLICDKGFIQTSTISIPTQLAQDVLFDESLPFGQDTDFCIRLANFGATFVMQPNPLVVWKDHDLPNRVSSSGKYQALLEWTDNMRPHITERSYRVYRGWHIARMAMPLDPIFGAKLYSIALLSGSFSIKMAILCALQVFMPRRAYRWLSDTVVRLKGKALN